MDTKSSNDTPAETKPEQPASVLTEAETILREMLDRRTKLGEYNQDCADILKLTDCLLAVVRTLNGSPPPPKSKQYGL